MDTFMLTQNIKSLIDDLKAILSQYGLGNSPEEYKIITQVFLYKFLNDKFLHDVRKAIPKYQDLSVAELERQLSGLPEKKYKKDVLLVLGPDTAKLKPTHFISYLFANKDKEDFHTLFDKTLKDIADFNSDIFAVQTGEETRIKLFDDHLSRYVLEEGKRDTFCKGLIDKIQTFSMLDVFDQKYDFFADIFEYLIHDYNKDSGKYAEYYTPRSIASIIATILAPNGDKNVTVYDPAAGSGTLILALAHQIGEKNCTIYTQDISQKSNEFMRLNLILNNLVHSLPNVIHDDTLLYPHHKDKATGKLRKFDYIVSNPPFNVDFSGTRDTLAGDNYKNRFWAGVPNIPPKKKDSMDIYLMFLQHIIFSLNEKGKAAVVVKTGFLTDQNRIPVKIRQTIVDNNWLKGVVSMPKNLFANTPTNVSVIFIDKTKTDDKCILIDASKLGEKKKENKKQRTVLRDSEVQKIINTFIHQETVEDFSVIVTTEQIKGKNCSFSAGQYFKVKIGYVELTENEFNEKINGYKERLKKLFKEGSALEEDIKKQMERLKYE